MEGLNSSQVDFQLSNENSQLPLKRIMFQIFCNHVRSTLHLYIIFEPIFNLLPDEDLQGCRMSRLSSPV